MERVKTVQTPHWYDPDRHLGILRQLAHLADPPVLRWRWPCSCPRSCDPGGSGAETPLCDWFSGVGEAAQALADGQPERSEEAARRALAARPRGTAAARASAALGLALRARGAHAAAADALEVALAPPTAPARAELAYLRGEALLLYGDAPAAARLLGEAARRGAAGGGPARRLPRRARPARRRTCRRRRSRLLEPLLRLHPADPAAQAARLDLAAARLALPGRGRGGGAPIARSGSPPPDRRPEAAGERLETWRHSGGPVPAPSPEDHLLRAERLLADGRAEAALREAERAAADEPAPPTWSRRSGRSALAGAGPPARGGAGSPSR